MSRLPNMLDRSQVPEPLQDAYDNVAGSRQGSVSGPYGVMLHSPELAVRGSALSNYLRWNSALTQRQRETAIMVVARHLDAAVMWAGHIRLGREAGIREEVIDVIANRKPLDSLAPEEAEIVRYARE